MCSRAGQQQHRQVCRAKDAVLWFAEKDWEIVDKESTVGIVSCCTNDNRERFWAEQPKKYENGAKIAMILLLIVVLLIFFF